MTTFALVLYSLIKYIFSALCVAFTELFENVFSDEEGSYCQPSLDLLDNYFVRHLNKQ